MALMRFTFNATLALLTLDVPPLSAMARLFCKASSTVALITCTAAAYCAEDDLRQRLTEREDKRRPLVPWSTQLAGRPLTVSGEYEVSLESQRQRGSGDDRNRHNPQFMKQSAEAEAFYSFGPSLSAFAQLRVATQRDLSNDTSATNSYRLAERGEMWLNSQHIGGSEFNLEVGRLHFEDDRRWWWDDDLDAIRLSFERPTFNMALALARELGRSSTERNSNGSNDHIGRLIGEITWDFWPNHDLTLFLMHHRDPSSPVLNDVRKEAFGANLNWIGARSMGAFRLGHASILGYWLDAAWLRGSERNVRDEDVTPARGDTGTSLQRKVRGSAVDVGINWALPLPQEPRFFGGYAIGSGGGSSRAGVDRTFRQSGIQANESGFGGVRRYPHYGLFLQPELSNLKITTVGAGISILKSSSLDIVYHRYAQASAAPSLRGAKLETTPSGASREVGAEFDLVMAIEEWKKLELELGAAAFRAGRAFGPDEGTWTYRAFVTIRLAF